LRLIAFPARKFCGFPGISGNLKQNCKKALTPRITSPRWTSPQRRATRNGDAVIKKQALSRPEEKGVWQGVGLLRSLTLLV